MKFRIRTSPEILVFLFSVFVFLSSLVIGADAQTARKKKIHKIKPPVTSQNPPPSGEPTIVSRATDYQDDNLVSNSVTSGNSPADISTVETERDRKLADMSAHIKRLESEMKNGYDEKQKRLLLNLDILTKAEQRSESLRKQRFDLIEKESQIRTRLDQIDNDIRPEQIDRTVAFAGSLRPEELRENRRKSLDAERKNLQALLADVQATRATLEQSVLKADQLVEKLRTKLEGDIDKALDDDKNQ